MQETVQGIPRLLTGFGQYSLDDAGRHILQHVRSIVQTDLFDRVDNFSVRKAFHELGSRVVRHEGERLGRHILPEEPEDNQPVVLIQFFQHGSQIGRVHLTCLFTKLFILFLHEAVQDLLLQTPGFFEILRVVLMTVDIIRFVLRVALIQAFLLFFIHRH